MGPGWGSQFGGAKPVGCEAEGSQLGAAEIVSGKGLFAQESCFDVEEMIEKEILQISSEERGKPQVHRACHQSRSNFQVAFHMIKIVALSPIT